MNRLPTFHYLVEGPEGAPWLTFIPGIGNDASFWEEQAHVLASRFRVLRFDPWGHGRSPQPPEACRFADILAGIVQLWDELDIPRSHVVGLGFGGSQALALGLDHPRRIGRIAAFCCRPRQPDDRRDFWRARCQAARDQGIARLADVTVDRWLRPEFRLAHPEVDERLRRMMKATSLAGYLAYVEAFIEMDFSARFAELAVPTLLVAAEHDHGGGPVEAMREMAACNPHTRLAVLEGAGHIVNHEAPRQVQRLLDDFFAG
ncbi:MULTISPECIES: alpha/beta fold hydrolase [unclassified Pseudomonas]|uniref:alpha/beta fold hydrolase n=1 Tax=unclassified Pseudomonas TaxID=196821 RepID=UPI0002A2CC05|nr:MULTISPECIES: alpha/beta fold hydrolase [unclassified Pseudomonas]MBB1606091.1 3-oxoadipate enol-lactonase [Pseudomonas sp. UMC76]MBB1636564.1 3-oxoadipate enol-lactonase [Pseudomonas sp. UME83]NTX92272.1 alpha/beta fold hydrolase [Pseudomonas sp. UMA643]NTY19946.1 alpha/beta fold hydrolase [Pseudomonas sp. UMC3103]NTY27682.1 alpha/beta fold hydrolase [Pseudomonas sp. UMA603]